MHRRKLLKVLGKSTLSLGVLSAFSFRELADDFQIREVRNGVFIYTNKGGTIIFKNTTEGWVVVDTQFPEQSKILIDELGKIKTSPIALLINTHHHGDHSGGNISFKGLVNKVVAHENSLKNQKAVAAARNIENTQLYPTDTFKDTWSQNIGDERITLKYFGAAHTDGDAWVHFEKANVVHTGDLLFNRRHPFVDRSAGASVKSWIKVLESASNSFENDVKFVFGHAAEGYDVVGDKKDLAAFKEYLEKAYSFVNKKIIEGVELEKIKAIKEFDFKSTWGGDGISRILSALVDEIKV